MIYKKKKSTIMKFTNDIILTYSIHEMVIPCMEIFLKWIKWKYK
jgi:hypothetical protein